LDGHGFPGSGALHSFSDKYHPGTSRYANKFSMIFLYLKDRGIFFFDKLKYKRMLITYHNILITDPEII
jgi:hypothetical protein